MGSCGTGRTPVAQGQAGSPSCSPAVAVPDDLVVAVVNESLAAISGAGGFVIDGFPGTLSQARHAAVPALDAVVHLAVPDDVACLESAGTPAPAGPTTPAETPPHAVSDRFTTNRTGLELYRRRGILTTVDGTQPPEQVTEAILQALPIPGPTP